MAAMCGVLVFISDAGTAAAQSDEIAAALESQHHRGPDETGVVIADRDVIFAHKRLSIIDVELSHEPMPYPPTGPEAVAICSRSTARSTTTSSCGKS